MTRSTTFTALSLALLARAAAAWDCKLSLGSEQFDLTSLNKVHTVVREVLTPPTTTKWTYSVSLCSPLPLSSAEDPCPDDTFVCAIVESLKPGYDNWLISVVPIAQEAGLSPSAAYLEGESNVEKGWTLNLGGGSYNEVPQKVAVEMVCDASASSDTAPTFVSYSGESGELKLKWFSAAACSTTSDAPPLPPPSDDKDTPKEGDKTPPKEDEPTSGGGMGFFSWFFTLFFLVLTAYFAIGCYSNYTQYGATGWDMVPHRDVWRDLPYVVADLFRGRGGGRSGYSSLG